MMQRFEAATLEEAYAQAARAYSCSVTELDIQVVQHPSRGLFGFGKKRAIIMVTSPRSIETAQSPSPETSSTIQTGQNFVTNEEVPGLEQTVETNSEAAKEGTNANEKEESTITATAPEKEMPSGEHETVERLDRSKEIFDNFYTEKPDIGSVAREVEEKINALFELACFAIDKITVSPYDEETLLIEFGGEDAALLIGKEGYRYKALAYLLYNWIHGNYGYRVRLEIAEFLHNQEAMIENYLETLIPRIENEGRASTKVLDGILVQIALQKLRERYPNKYVAIRTNREGGRYVIVNEFMEKG